MRVFSSYWVIKYRDNPKSDWTDCPRLKNGWVADPFIYTFNGCTAVFAEIMDYRTGKGYIGCSVWDGDGFGSWMPVIQEKWHLSYPLIFELDQKLYMIPEQYQSKEIAFYECETFPNKWRRLSPLVKGGEYVDNTILFQNEDIWIFSLKLSETEKNKGSFVRMHLKSISEIDKVDILFETASDCRRPAGNFIIYEGNIFRPAQDCKKIYGGGLILYKVEECTSERYEEKEFRRVYADDLAVIKKTEKYIGIHTYNRDCVSNIEVIDLKQKKIIPRELFYKFLRRIEKIR